MTVRRLLNADALFALTLGLVLMLNGLLGPRFPFGAGLAAVLGVALLVAAVLLGQGGMGKGPLTTRLRKVGLTNVAAAAVLFAYAAAGLDGAARIFAITVATITSVIGAAQLASTPTLDAPNSSMGHRRATPAELRAAIGRAPSDPPK